MENFLGNVSGIRQFITRKLSFQNLSRTPSFDFAWRSNNPTPSEELPSAGKRARDDADVDMEDVRYKRARTGDMDTSREATSQPDVSQGKEKYKRRLRGTRQVADSQASTPSKPRLGPKRQCALLIGYCGSGWSGMQIQKGVKTIEGQLFDALVKVGAVSEDNSNDPTKVNIQRAARTDAGVHATRNVVSIKIIKDVPGVPDLVSRINEELPPEIRLWDIVRTQNSFNSRTNCDGRRYNYFLPSYLLVPPQPGSLVAEALKAPPESETSYDTGSHPFWNAVTESPENEPVLDSLRQWRIDTETLELFRAILKTYSGTHNFWNLTVAKEYKDPSSKRHMKSIEVVDPVVYGTTEWLSVVFHGQSFMLHQIRKMMGLAILLTRARSGESQVSEVYKGRRLVGEAFKTRRLHIPKAPALGLLLEEPLFDSYNRKIQKANAQKSKPSSVRSAASRQSPTKPSSTRSPAKVSPTKSTRSATLAAKNDEITDDEAGDAAVDDIRDPVDFKPYKENIEAFKQEYIYEKMRNTEDEEGTFYSWLSGLDAQETTLYYELRGLTPPSTLTNRTRQANGKAKGTENDSDDDLDQNLLGSEEMEG